MIREGFRHPYERSRVRCECERQTQLHSILSGATRKLWTDSDSPLSDASPPFGMRCQAFLALCLFPFLRGSHCHGAKAQTTTESGGIDIPYEELLEKALQTLLRPLDPLFFPLIPTIGVSTASLSLTSVNISGLSSNLQVPNVEVPGYLPGGSQGRDYTVEINYDLISIYAAEYSAGGYFYNMPFTGESYMRATFEGVTVIVGMTTQVPQIFCIKPGSTTYQLDVRKPVVYFDNLSPGTDQGLLMNTVISSFVPDIVAYLENAMNEGPLHDIVDGILVAGLNSILCNRENNNSNSFRDSMALVNHK